jgi:hypothetical protein
MDMTSGKGREGEGKRRGEREAGRGRGNLWRKTILSG